MISKIFVEFCAISIFFHRFYFTRKNRNARETRFALNYPKLNIFDLASVLNTYWYNPSNPYDPSDFMYIDFKRILRLTNNKIVHIQRFSKHSFDETDSFPVLFYSSIPLSTLTNVSADFIPGKSDIRYLFEWNLHFNEKRRNRIEQIVTLWRII